MLKLALVSLVTVAAVSLTACSSISTTECQTASPQSWRDRGISDGSYGYYPTRFQSYVNECQAVGVQPNREMWERGYQEGLKRYCSAENAYSDGVAGLKLSNVCPAHLQAELAYYHARGQRAGELKQELEENRKEIKRLIKERESMRRGDSLGFKSEYEARRYYNSLPYQIYDAKDEYRYKQEQLNRIRAGY